MKIINVNATYRYARCPGPFLPLPVAVQNPDAFQRFLAHAR